MLFLVLTPSTCNKPLEDAVEVTAWLVRGCQSRAGAEHLVRERTRAMILASQQVEHPLTGGEG